MPGEHVFTISTRCHEVLRESDARMMLILEYWFGDDTTGIPDSVTVVDPRDFEDDE